MQIQTATRKLPPCVVLEPSKNNMGQGHITKLLHFMAGAFVKYSSEVLAKERTNYPWTFKKNAKGSLIHNRKNLPPSMNIYVEQFPPLSNETKTYDVFF